MLDKVQESLIRGGIAGRTPAAIVYKATWDDERICICTVDSLARTGREAGIDRLAVVLIGEAVEHGRYEHSRLYAKDFFTGYRDASV